MKNVTTAALNRKTRFRLNKFWSWFIATLVVTVFVLAFYLISDYTESYAAGSSPEVTLKYVPNGSYVAIAVYWNDINGGSSILWANDVIASGADLDWTITGLTFNNLGGTDAFAVLSNAEKYKNYYFKLVKDGKTTVFRAFPVDFSTETGPRHQNDYAHGNFGLSTSMCGVCHNTHSGLKSYLLTQSSYYDLCLFCHGTASTQSKYDVVSGSVYTAAGWKDSLAGPIDVNFGTSQHNVDDRSSVETTVYGSAPGKILTFTCLSCHKAHGSANDNYRLLRDIIYPSNDRSIYTTVNYTAYSIVKDPVAGENLYMVSGNSEFCSACHADYDDGSAQYPGTTYGTTSYYRHPVTVGDRVYSVYRSAPYRNWYPESGDNLPLQVYGAGESIDSDKRTAVVCSTCHFAHGTKKQFNEGYPMGGSTRQWVYNQKMLRLDNYGVCESCHKK